MRLQILTFTLILTAGSLSAQAPPVPAEYQDIYSTLTTQIAGFDAAVNAGWNGSTYPYLDAPQLSAADSNQYTTILGSTFYTYAVLPELEELQALGANAVTVHIDFPTFYQPFYTYEGNPSQYQQFVSFYQQLAQDVRARGMKLVVEASVSMPLVGNQISVFQPYMKSLSWSEYMSGRAANALAVAQLIEPDYMTVMTEPDTEAATSGQTNLNTLTGVTQLVQQVLTTLQDANVTNVQIGAGAGTWTTNYMEYVQAFASMPMNFVDMHIYPINEGYFTAALTAAATIQAAGKQVGISECWDWKIRNSEIGVLSYASTVGRDPFSFWAPIDTAFLQAIVNFANYQQLAFISPYWVHYFFAYLDYNTYGSLTLNTLMTDSYTAATNANLVGAFTSTGHAWESQNIPPDTTPPATPAAPLAPVIGYTGANLQWVADTDNVGVSAYNLYRNGALLSTTSLLLYYDSGLVSGATYTYTLTATDASGNVSAMSAPLVIQTFLLSPPAVTAISATPSSGSGASQTFAFVFSDSAGAADITAAQIGFNTSMAGSNACWMYYAAATETIYLSNNSGAFANPGLTLGSSGTLQNSQCTINVNASSVSLSGDTLTLNLALSFAPSFAGAQNIYTYVQDATVASGFTQEGTWTVPGASGPVPVSVTPNSGSGSSQTFAFVFSDSAGTADITAAQIGFNTSTAGTNSCWMYYATSTQTIYLANNAGAFAGGGLVLGSSGTLQNSQCTINVNTSSVSLSGNTLTLNLALSFSPTFGGAQNIYMYVQNATLANGFTQEGTWTVPGASGPVPVSVTPSSGSGSSQTFAFMFSDAAGAADITAAQIGFNTSMAGTNSCWIYYAAATETIYLANDAGAFANGGLTLGTSGTLQNNQCTITVNTSSVSPSGNTLTLNLALSFAPAFAGTQNIYMYVQNATLSNGFTQEGTWTVP
jgi:hypothetical protein